MELAGTGGWERWISRSFQVKSVWGSVSRGRIQSQHKSSAKREKAPKKLKAKSAPGGYFEIKARIEGEETGDSRGSDRSGLMAFLGVSLIKKSRFLPQILLSPFLLVVEKSGTQTPGALMDGQNPTWCFLCSSNSHTKRSFCYWNSPQQSIRSRFTVENWTNRWEQTTERFKDVNNSLVRFVWRLISGFIKTCLLLVSWNVVFLPF